MKGGRHSPDYTQGEQAASDEPHNPPVGEDDNDDDDEYGPTLPQAGSGRGGAHAGPTIPNIQDLELKRGTLFASAQCVRSTKPY